MSLSEWQILSFKEAGVQLIDCDHKTPPASSYGYPYVTIPQIKNGRIDVSEARRITAEHFKEWTRKANPKPFDVVLSRRCNPGETAHVPAGLEFALGQNLVLLRANGEKVFPRYLRWLTRGVLWWEQISKFINVGAVFDSLRCADVPNFQFPIPALHEQKAIASILTALDDKIELNRRMNANLEAMARAVFKSWFVDFDPVRAKMAGRQPFGMSAATAALFPSRLAPSELGDIPEGWSVDQIGNAVTAVGGSTPSTENLEYWTDGQYAWVTPKDLSALKSPVLFTTERRITDAGIRVISSGLLPSGTVLMSSRAPIGYIAIAETSVAINQGFIAIVCDKELPNLYVWQWLHANLDMIKSHANGSTFQEISKGSFRPLPCIIPSAKVLEKFQAIVLPIWQKLVANEKECLGLEKTRDYLLPKLISGDIRIRDAEKFMEAA